MKPLRQTTYVCSIAIGFADAYDAVVTAIRNLTNSTVSGRPAKSTTAIVEKLKRESIRFSQMQDIAGCRIVVDELETQDALCTKLTSQFSGSRVFDRREKSSFGYRAIHLIVFVDDHFVEIQIRTRLQHLWAELSEKLADRHGIDLKYGGGSKEWGSRLQQISSLIRILEGGNSEIAPESIVNHDAKQKIFDAGTNEVRSLLDILINAVEGKQ